MQNMRPDDVDRQHQPNIRIYLTTVSFAASTSFGTAPLSGVIFIVTVITGIARQARERLFTQQSPWMGLEAEVAADAYGWN